MSSETVRTEFQRLQSHSVISNACVSCAKQSIRCYHPKATFYDKVKELKLKRTLKPLILVICLNSFYETCNIMVWRPYSIQMIKAYGMPLDADITRVILSVISFVASGCFLFNVKTFGKRKMYLYSTAVAVICAFGLSESFIQFLTFIYLTQTTNFSTLNRYLWLRILSTKLDIFHKLIRLNDSKF